MYEKHNLNKVKITVWKLIFGYWFYSRNSGRKKDWMLDSLFLLSLDIFMDACMYVKCGCVYVWLICMQMCVPVYLCLYAIACECFHD